MKEIPNNLPPTSLGTGSSREQEIKNVTADVESQQRGVVASPTQQNNKNKMYHLPPKTDVAVGVAVQQPINGKSVVGFWQNNGSGKNMIGIGLYFLKNKIINRCEPCDTRFLKKNRKLKQ